MMTFNFANDLKIPNIYKELDTRKLQDEAEEFDDRLEEWLDVTVGSFVYEAGAEEISIIDYQLKKMYNSTMMVFVIFEHPELISLEAKYPDSLQVKFT